jgi:hypothetical protein
LPGDKPARQNGFGKTRGFMAARFHHDGVAL